MTTDLTFSRGLALAALGTLAASNVALAQVNMPDAPISAQVIEGWQTSEGQYLAALRLTLAPGWKTYWRAPGDAGIPPHFDWGRARNVAAISIGWPTPVVFHDNGMRSIGYKEQVTLPLTITPRTAGTSMRLMAKVNLGVCADVCVPYAFSIDTTVDASGTSPVPSVAAAFASLPYSAQEAGVKGASCRISPTSDGMQIEATLDLPHTGGREETVIEPGVPGLWVSEPETTRSGRTLTATSEMIHADGGSFSINRSDVRITVLGQDYAVDVRGCTAG